jgi:hypothetical protein
MNCQYYLNQFHEDLATKIIWGRSQTLAVWVLDQDTGSEWKIRRDEHFQQMIKDRMDERLAKISVDVVNKDGGFEHGSSCGSKAICLSGVTNGSKSGLSVVADQVEGCGDTCSSPAPDIEPNPSNPAPVMIDWTSLTILEDDDDGLPHQIADEDQVYEAMGFKEANGRMEAEDRTDEVVIPAMSTQMHAEMEEAAVEVDDTVPEEPMFEWDRDNPDMSVGICYPSMPEFRLAMRQYVSHLISRRKPNASHMCARIKFTHI